MDEMHLFDPDAGEEKALCGSEVSAVDLLGADHYLERRRQGLSVGTVCEPCKAVLVALAGERCRNLETCGPPDEAKELRQLIDLLEREVAPDDSG